MKPLVLHRNYLLIALFILFFSCSDKNNKRTKNQQPTPLKQFNKLAGQHKKLGKPKVGDWLYYHDEKGQAYTNYVNKKNKVCPNNKLHNISILPLGRFSPIEQKLLKETALYVSTFFQLNVELLAPVSDDIVPDVSRRINGGLEQIHTRFVLDSILVPFIPDSAICFVSITNVDLYPADDWNFVFGQAYLTKRTGVSSIRRYFNQQLDSSSYFTCFERTIKTTTHELCHMFSLKHCRIYECLLNGSNHMEEADSRPLWLCPECLAKLQYCIRFDLLERYNALAEYYSSLGMEKEMRFYKKSEKLMTR